MPSQQSQPYPPDFFRRQDESDDQLFYAQPRLVVHIAYGAIAAIGEYLGRELPSQGTVLDLMSSWRSHLPEDHNVGRLVGLGMNAVEMAENPQLDGHVVHDLNANPRMPFDDNSFDAAVVTVSIQYMTRPVEIFSDVRRVLKQGAAFHVIYSDRLFPTKSVAVWQTLNAPRRAELIASYFQNSGGWEAPRALDASRRESVYTDPVYVVTAKKASSDANEER